MSSWDAAAAQQMNWLINLVNHVIALKLILAVEIIRMPELSLNFADSSAWTPRGMIESSRRSQWVDLELELFCQITIFNVKNDLWCSTFKPTWTRSPKSAKS